MNMSIREPRSLLKAMCYSTPRDSEVASLHANEVSDSTINFLQANGNFLSEEHKQALLDTAHALSCSFYAKQGRRTLIPLFTGGGKTQTVVAHIDHVLKKDEDRGIWISVNTVDEINEILKSLHDRGIDEGKIGVKHSKEGSNVTSANAHKFQVVITTHERIRSCNHEYLINYQDKQRQVIWDEALISTKTIHLNLDNLVKETHIWEAHYERYRSTRQETGEHRKTSAYFHMLRELIEKEKDKQLIQLPRHPGNLKLDIYTSAILETIEAPFNETAFLDKGSHLFNWHVNVPDYLENIVILDASGKQRILERFDQSIKIYPAMPNKDYSDVTLHYCRANSGKHTINDPERNRVHFQEYQHIIDNLIPRDKNVVCFHLPTKEGIETPTERLNLLLSNESKERMKYKSWGESKGINSLSNEEYGIHIGMIYREHNELKTAIAAQKRDTLYKVDDKERHQVQLSEHADQLYQAINRMRCRCTNNGKALPTEMYIFYPDANILLDLEKLMPQVKIETYRPRFLPVKESSYLLCTSIIRYLQDNSFEEISISSLRQRLNIEVRKDSSIWRDTKELLSYQLTEHGYLLKPGARSIVRI